MNEVCAAIREICQEACARRGEPPCWDIDEFAGGEFEPCDECSAGADYAATLKAKTAEAENGG